MSLKLKNSPKILSLDISTKTIGFAVMDINGSELLELTHFSPKIKPQPEDKIEELLLKSTAFGKHLEKYKEMGIVQIVIEEPLLNSNNVYTVAMLLRYNSMIVKLCYDTFGIVPKFISTYDARKYAFPDLIRPNEKGRNVLFGGFPKDIDKKQIIWEHVNLLFNNIKWPYTKKGTLKKEAYDESDAVTAGIGYMNKIRTDKNENL